MVQRHLPRAQGRLLDLHHRDRRGPAGDRRALRLRGAAGHRRPHRGAQARPHRPRPTRRGPDAAQQGGARQRHRQRRPRLRAVGPARQDRRQNYRRPALPAGANPPAPPPPLRFLGGALRLGRPPRVRGRRGGRLRGRGLHRLQDAPGHPLGLVGRHRRPLPEDSAPGRRGGGRAHGPGPRRQLPPLDGGGAADRRGTRRNGLGLVRGAGRTGARGLRPAQRGGLHSHNRRRAVHHLGPVRAVHGGGGLRHRPARRRRPAASTSAWRSAARPISTTAAYP